MRSWDLVVRLGHRALSLVSLPGKQPFRLRRAIPALMSAIAATGMLFAASAHASPEIDIDFEDPSDADLWTPLAGEWTVAGGEYIGAGPNQDPSCSTIFSPTYLNEFSPKNLEIEVDMTALDGSVDKLILLRATPDLCSVSEIQINFRSDPYNDVAVVETVNNDGRILQFFPLSQPEGESVHARIRLVSRHLTVWVNCNTTPLVDQDFDFRIVDSGSVGLGVVFSGEVAFDNFSVGSPGGKHTGAQGRPPTCEASP